MYDLGCHFRGDELPSSCFCFDITGECIESFLKGGNDELALLDWPIPFQMRYYAVIVRGNDKKSPKDI